MLLNLGYFPCIAQQEVEYGDNTQSEVSVFIERDNPIGNPSTFYVLNSNNSTDWEKDQLPCTNHGFSLFYNNEVHHYRGVDVYAGSIVTGGPTGPVIVSQNANVSYYSKVINLEQGFQVKPNGKFVAKIQPCESTFRPIKLDTNQKSYPRPKPMIEGIDSTHKPIALPFIYPDPSKGKFTVQLLPSIIETDNHSAIITIYDVMGNMIYS